MDRSLSARAAKSIFFEEYNDVDIFIEDTALGYSKLFEELFSRVFEGRYKIANVFPLGSRDTVITACRDDQGRFLRPTLYVVDGDLHLMHVSVESLDGLYVLPYYCVENILVDEGGIHKILNQESPVVLREQLLDRFDYSGWLQRNYLPMLTLFIEYGVAFSLSPHLQTVAFEISDLVSSNTGDVDLVKVGKRKAQIESSIVAGCGRERYETLKATLQQNIPLVEHSFVKYVSGKDYILPLLLMRLRKFTSTKTPTLNLKVRLAMICDITGIRAAADFVAQPMPLRQGAG